MKSVLALFSYFLIAMSFANTTDSLRSEQRQEGLFVVHEVEEEETLYSIAKRYKGSVIDIIKHNQIVDNKIDIGQLLYVLVQNDKPIAATLIQEPLLIAEEGFHIVEAGQTLYSISKQYNVKVADLKKWNDLTNNDLPLGLKLKVKEVTTQVDSNSEVVLSEEPPKDELEDSVAVEVKDPFDGFERYLVQTGETITTIATKIGVSMDSLKLWNDLKSDYLRIGEELMYKKSDSLTSVLPSQPKKSNRSQIDERGFEKIFEEGVASVIQSMKTSKFLALHRTLPIGTNLEIRNLMNNQVVHVKVVGRLPNTGLNKNLLLRLSQPAYDQLGILDSKSRVEVSYYKQ